jgi:hypothetical protein
VRATKPIDADPAAKREHFRISRDHAAVRLRARGGLAPRAIGRDLHLEHDWSPWRWCVSEGMAAQYSREDQPPALKDHADR